ncbi:MAG: class I SAM-dependent methyltransferase [Xanthomonadales bacterium]|nr:class I SAM-dependent methyltransferase [Xanthomonadales bacterium]
MTDPTEPQEGTRPTDDASPRDPTIANATDSTDVSSTAADAAALSESDPPAEDAVAIVEPPRYRVQAGYPDGHFYSPVVNTADIDARQAEIWPAQPELLGIDFNDAAQQALLREVFPAEFAGYDYPDKLDADAPEDRYYSLNTEFGWLDSRVYFALLRHFRPARVLEVGAGYSTLLSTDVNRRFLNSSARVACIEPYPRPFLKTLDGLSELIEERVERVPMARFAELGAGDLLFIDSSHVAKTGSDVNYLYFEVLPRLRAGVRIHIHDIFFPHDYPPDWVLTENRSWNEQYILRALLMDSSRYRVLFGCRYAHHHWPELVGAALNLPDGQHFGGSSFWIEVI